MTAREARARGVQVHGDVPDHAVLHDRLVSFDGVTYQWEWRMACVANHDGSIPDSRIVVVTPAERDSMRRRPWSRR